MIDIGVMLTTTAFVLASAIVDSEHILKKEYIKELLGRSPDYSDAMMMRLWYEIGMKDYFG